MAKFEFAMSKIELIFLKMTFFNKCWIRRTNWYFLTTLMFEPLCQKWAQFKEQEALRQLVE